MLEEGSVDIIRGQGKLDGTRRVTVVSNNNNYTGSDNSSAITKSGNMPSSNTSPLRTAQCSAACSGPHAGHGVGPSKAAPASGTCRQSGLKAAGFARDDHRGLPAALTLPPAQHPDRRRRPQTQLTNTEALPIDDREGSGGLGRSSEAAGRAVLDALDDRDVGLAAALAHRLQAVAAAGALELVQQRGHQPGAGRAERVAERDRAAVDVDLGEVGAGLLLPREHDRRERLVDLDEVDVVERHARSSRARTRWPGSAR